MQKDELTKAQLIKYLGIIAYNSKNTEEAIKHFLTSKKMFFNLGSTLGQASCLLAIGYLHKKLQEFKHAKINLENALSHYIALKHKFAQHQTHQLLGHVKFKLPQFKENAKKDFFKAKEIMESVNFHKTGRSFIGGTYVQRWQGIIGFFIEVPISSPELFHKIQEVQQDNYVIIFILLLH